MRQRTKSILSLTAAAFLLYLSFRKLDPRLIWESISTANPFYLFLAVILNAFHYLPRAIRWRWLLRPFKTGIRLLSLLTTTFIGFLISWIFPGRLGEIVRPVLLARKEDLPVSGALATIVLERILDAATVVILFAAAMFWVPSGPMAGGLAKIIDPMYRAGKYAAIAALILFPILLVLFLSRHRLMKAFKFYPGRSGRGWRATLVRWGNDFVIGFRGLVSPERFSLVLLYSIGLWILIGLNTWLVLRAFHIQSSFMATFLFLPLPVLGIAVPTPGGVGSFEILCRWGMENLFGAPPHEAIAAAVTLHFVSLVPVLLFGSASIWKQGISLRGLTGKQDGIGKDRTVIGEKTG